MVPWDTGHPALLRPRWGMGSGPRDFFQVLEYLCAELDTSYPHRGLCNWEDSESQVSKQSWIQNQINPIKTSCPSFDTSQDIFFQLWEKFK